MAGVAPSILAPIASVQTISGNQARIRHLLENAAKTFQKGAPVVFSGGYVQESAAIVADTTQIIGFANEPAHNLTAAGTPQGGISTGFKVPNQPSAVVVALGSPITDGTIEVELAVEDTLFLGYVDGAHTLAVTDIATKVGLTKDAVTGFWFVDTTIAGGAGQVLEIVELYDPVGTVGGRVIFKVNKANQALAD